MLLLFYLLLSKNKMSVGLRSLFYFAYIANSKTGVGFREIFQSGKGFHRQESEKITALCQSVVNV
jgi:hypothetical protein